MDTLLREIKDNYKYFVIDVPHQIPPTAYWIDDLEDLNDKEGLHTQIVCETVEDIRALLYVPGEKHRKEHQFGMIDTLARKNLKRLCDECEVAAESIAADIGSTLEELVIASRWTTIFERMQDWSSASLKHCANCDDSHCHNSNEHCHVSDWMADGDLEGDTYQSLTEGWLSTCEEGKL